MSAPLGGGSVGDFVDPFEKLAAVDGADNAGVGALDGEPVCSFVTTIGVSCVGDAGWGAAERWPVHAVLHRFLPHLEHRAAGV